MDPSGYLPYGIYRDTVFSFIKGERTPVGMMIQLILPRALTRELMVSSSCGIPEADVESLSIIIRFKDGSLSVATGTSIKNFYLDRSLEEALAIHIRERLLSLVVSFNIIG